MARNKFNVDEELNEEFNLSQIKRAIKYVKPYKKGIAVTILIMLISSLASLLGPYLISIAMDKTIVSGNIQQLMIIAAVYVLTLVITAVCTNLRVKIMSKIGQSIIYNLRTDLFEHLQKLPFTYYDNRPHGKILVRVVNYVNSVSDLLSNGIINLITDLFSLIVIIGFMLYINVRLTLVCMAGLPLLFISIFIIKKAQRRGWQNVSRKQSNLNAYLHESIMGMKVTQSFCREEENLKIFTDLNKEYRRAWMHAQRISFLFSPIVENISTLGSSFVYMMGVVWVSGEVVSVGVLTAFLMYIGRFWAPISNISGMYNQILSTAAYLERIFETLDEEPVVKDLPDAETMPQIQGKVEFKNVNFGYEEGQLILKDVSFTVNPGDTIALVGPTGAGKTTIVNLISRFYNVNSGEIEIDGHDISKVTLSSLRKQMGVMLQDTFIFSGTIMDNIRYGRLDATDEEVIRAAKAVKAHDFICELKDGYQTQVNERGSRLSTGQRQLISFARALLADPRILILDEATSSIDTKTEAALQEGLAALLKGRTSFVIAHRLSTIKNSTCIMYIDDGRIIESGTHDELMAKKGAYWKLYMSQYKMQEAV